MVGTRKLARLADHAERAAAKLVLVGDHKQLPEIDAGGAFAALQQVVPTSELAGNRRQREQWERHALVELRAGSVAAAVAAYHQRGRLHMADSVDAVRHHMVDDWWAAHQHSETAVMYALRRADVDDLNHRARRYLDQAGRLGPDRLTAAGREFAAGDEVLCLRNDRRLGVRNGTRSTIAAVDVTDRTATLDSGVVLPASYLDAGHLGYSYATTVHKGQGATVDHAFLLGSDSLFREAGYVGLSRARHANHLYIVGPGLGAEPDPPDPMADTIRHLGNSRAQTVASHQLPSAEPPNVAHPEIAALLSDPPRWLTESIGPPPVTDHDRREWARTAGRIAAYRDIHQVTDPDIALGPRPTDSHQRQAFELAAVAIDQYQRSIEIDQEKGLEL